MSKKTKKSKKANRNAASSALIEKSLRPSGTAKAMPAIAAQAVSPGESRDPRLPSVGTILVKRNREGRRCECAVEEEGFRYEGTLHRSLSSAATAAAVDLGINGRVNGFVFWGLVRASRGRKAPGQYLRKIACRYEEQVAILLNDSQDANVRTEVRLELETHAAQLTELLAHAAA